MVPAGGGGAGAAAGGEGARAGRAGAAPSGEGRSGCCRCGPRRRLAASSRGRPCRVAAPRFVPREGGGGADSGDSGPEGAGRGEGRGPGGRARAPGGGAGAGAAAPADLQAQAGRAAGSRVPEPRLLPGLGRGGAKAQRILPGGRAGPTGDLGRGEAGLSGPAA